MNSLKFIQFSILKPSQVLFKSAKNISNTHSLKFYLNQTQLVSSSSSNFQSSNESFENQSQKGSLAFTATENQNSKAESISRAMSYYLMKMSERESLMKVKTEEYEIGKRHLAKIMGENPDTFTQKDINKAIQYLLPSGLFERKARPFLKHPEAYYPKSILAAFGNDGRPLHTLFYTGNPKFYQLIHEITEKLVNLNKLEDAMNLIKLKMKNVYRSEDTDSKVDLTGSVWINKLGLSRKLNCKMDEFNYKKFLILIQKLADHPLSKKEEVFINKFKVPFVPPIKLSEIPALLVDEKGRSYQEVSTRQRTATVKLRLYEGTGNIKIKAPEGDFNITFFDSLTQREQILFPFKVVDRINKFDMEIEVNNGGMSCLAKAIRYAISKALCCYISADSIEKLRLAGLLTPDIRPKERKKPGQEGARRKYTWKKR